ncbi:restriction endonuclease subunit S [Flavobacterium sp. UMI-01]|uniref:restriction endonuclease subunit S n=1 Tax=Flavobacterium sp. UMI-01 TaxID=1441053 RepID=UPI001C7D66CC|nr:restriction endonuclease subunit S [Flavobacterium sp. UMI-01]GIZ09363.1 hypothetical protein FUMI01_20900 [Flavobacterium sp. UMI-01]
MKQEYKETELGRIPKEWEVKKLDALGVFFKGKGVPKVQITDNGFNCLTYGDLYTKYDVIINNVKSFIPKEVAKISQEIEYGDICFSGSGETLKEIGKCAVYLEKEPGYAGGDIIVFRGNQEPLALSYILNSTVVNRQKYKYGQGHSVVHIYSSQLKNLKIPLPPLPEQKAIAECLSTWDYGIKSQSQLIKAKEKRLKALMQQLLTGKKRLAGFTDEWGFTKFEDFYTENKIKANDSKYEVLSVTKNGIVSQSEYFNKEIASSDTSKYLVVKQNDFVMSGLNFWMGSYDVLNNFEIGIVSPAYKVYRLKKAYNSAYFRFFVKSKAMLDAMVGCSVMGASIVRRNFDKEILHEWSFKIPSFEEQTAIAIILKTAEKEIQIEKQKLTDLQKQKKGLMQQLLTGKVRLV